jgi:hypothetical protein
LPVLRLAASTTTQPRPSSFTSANSDASWRSFDWPMARKTASHGNSRSLPATGLPSLVVATRSAVTLPLPSRTTAIGRADSTSCTPSTLAPAISCT